MNRVDRKRSLIPTRASGWIGAALWIVCGQGALAQVPVASDEVKSGFRSALEKAREAEHDQYERASVGSPSETESGQDPLVAVEAGEANGRGTINFKPSADCDPVDPCWSVQVSAPTDKASGITDFTTLDGLAKDISLGFSVRKSPIGGDRELQDFFDDLDDLCDALGLEDSCDNALIAQKLGTLSGDELREALKKIEPLERYLSKARAVWFAGGKVSYNDYEFFDQANKARSTDELGASLKVGYARLIGEASRASFSVGVQRAYMDSKSKGELCTPVKDREELQSCKELPLGPPVEVDSLIARIELRRDVKGPKDRKMVATATVSYDFELDALGIDVPLYFFKDKNQKFTGGLRVGWRSDKGDVVASVFLAKPLDWPGE